MKPIRFELSREGRGYKEMRSLENALTNVVECDLAYGGRALVMEPMKVVTESSVIGVVDTTTYEGTEEDMSSLVTAITIHRHIDLLMSRCKAADMIPDKDRPEVEVAFRGSEWLYKEIGRSDTLGHIYHSNGRAKKVYMGMLQPQCEAELLALCKKSLSDIRALVCFKYIEKVAEEDFQALAYA